MEFRNWLESEPEEVLTEITPIIKSYLRNMGAKSEEIDDITQRILIATWKALTGKLGNKPRNLRSWLYTVTHNLFIRYRQSSERRKYPTLDPTEAGKRTFAKSDVEDVRIERLKEAIKRLRPNDQQILDLFYFKELSLKEICEMLDIPLGTAKRRLHMARNRLAEKMQDD